MPSVARLNSQAEALAQFKQFTDFARTSGGFTGRTVAQVGSQLGAAGNGAFASIAVKSRFDFIGNIGRRQQSRGENDDVRDLFKESVLKMCGCANEQQLPDKIREAMQFTDYNKGKPLTARRILAVQEAVRQHALEDTLTTAGIQLNDTIRDRIKTAVSACGNDPDAFAVLQETWKAVLFETQDRDGMPVANDAHLVPRGSWAVRSKVSTLASDIQSLRQITGGDQALFNAAKPFLALKDAEHPLSNSLLTQMVSAVQQMQPSDLAEISALGTHPDTQTAYKAALKLHELVNDASTRSGLARGPGDLTWIKDDYRGQLLASMILAKAIPSKATLTQVQTNLHAPNVRVLKNIYDHAQRVTIAAMREVGSGIDNLDVNKMADVCLGLSFSLNALVRAADQMCTGVLSADNPIEKLDNSGFASYGQANRQTVDTIIDDVWAKTQAERTQALSRHGDA